jgi:uncharacterized protein (DUF433 family)
MSATEVLRTEKSWIQKTPDVCGGAACIRDTRVPVWSVVAAVQHGTAAEDLQRYFVTMLSAADVAAAFAYYEQHRDEIDHDLRQNEEA